MKKKDLIKLSKDELQTKLTDDQEALVNLRFQKALQQLILTYSDKKIFFG